LHKVEQKQKNNILVVGFPHRSFMKDREFEKVFEVELINKLKSFKILVIFQSSQQWQALNFNYFLIFQKLEKSGMLHSPIGSSPFTNPTQYYY
jgi:hypothetical protein